MWRNGIKTAVIRRGSQGYLSRQLVRLARRVWGWYGFSWKYIQFQYQKVFMKTCIYPLLNGIKKLFCVLFQRACTGISMENRTRVYFHIFCSALGFPPAFCYASARNRRQTAWAAAFGTQISTTTLITPHYTSSMKFVYFCDALIEAFN